MNACTQILEVKRGRERIVNGVKVGTYWAVDSSNMGYYKGKGHHNTDTRDTYMLGTRKKEASEL